MSVPLYIYDLAHQRAAFIAERRRRYRRALLGVAVAVPPAVAVALVILEELR